MRAETTTRTRQRDHERRRAPAVRRRQSSPSWLAAWPAAAGAGDVGRQRAGRRRHVHGRRPGADPGSLDPHMSVFVTTNNVNSFAYETLVYLGHGRRDRARLGGELGGDADERHLHAQGRGHVRRRHAVDGLDGRRQLLVRRRSGQPVAAARPVRPPGHHRRGRRRGAHRHVDERSSPSRSCCRTPAPACSSSAPRAWPIAASSPRAPTAPVRSCSRRPSPTTTTRSAPGTTTPGGPTAPRARCPGSRPRWSLRIVENESTAANLLLSGEVNIAGIAGPDRQRVESEGYFVASRTGRSSVSSSSTTWTACRPPTSPCARR